MWAMRGGTSGAGSEDFGGAAGGFSRIWGLWWEKRKEEGVTGGGEGSVLGVGVIKEKAVEYGDLRTFS